MWIVNLKTNPNGSHNDHRADHITTIPDGWAMIPEDFAVPETFPFVSIEAEELTYIREVEIPNEVPKLRETGMADENGQPIMEEYTTTRMVKELRKYTMMTVTKMTEGALPEPIPKPAPEPTQLDRVEAQVTYTAMMTDTLLEV